MEALSWGLERLAISPDSTLYQPSSSQEETQSTTDDSISQATCAQYPKPPDNTENKGKVAALQWFVDECSIGPFGSIMKRPWSDPTPKTLKCYTRKAGEIIAEVVKTVAPQSAPELW